MQTSSKSLRSVFLISFLFFAHLAVVMYVSTTVLGAFASPQYVSMYYMLGAAGALALLFLLPRIVKKAGLVKTAATLFGLLAASLLMLGTTRQPGVFVTAFIAYTALTGTIWYCNDLFVAHYTRSTTAGHTRGSYLTVINAAIASMPIVAGFLVEHSGFSSVYIAGASLLFIATGLIVRSQRTFVDRPYVSATIPEAWNTIRHSRALRRVISINFLLQFFYVWMTLFAPLYLSQVLGFSWGQIGLMFSIMLTAFVIFQYGIGRLADRIGVKRLMIAGFSIASASTIAFSLLARSTHSFIAFTAVLFCTRVGICMVEVLAETYFFKQVTDSDEGIVSVYRMMYPLAYIIAPFAGWYIVASSSYSALFLVLGGLLALGAAYAMRLVDIR